MAHFINCEAIDIDKEEQEQEKKQNQDSSFIDNTYFEDQIASNYRLVKDSIENFQESSYSSCINVSVRLWP